MRRSFWTLMAACAVMVLGLSVGQLAGCSGTQVQQQARAADGVARAFNTVARPALVGTYELVCRAAVERVCPNPPCARAALQAALDACDRSWQPVFASYEAARAAHGAWRLTLMRCQQAPDAGNCALDLERDAANVLRAVTTYRCAVRAVGRADLDPIPGAVTCAAGDGGQS